MNTDNRLVLNLRQNNLATQLAVATATGFTIATDTQGDVAVYEISTITNTGIAAADLVQGNYFTLDTPANGLFHFWMDIDESGLGTPSVGGTNVTVSIVTGDTDQDVADAIALAINTDSNFGAVNGASTVTTVTNAVFGNVTDAADSTSSTVYTNPIQLIDFHQAVGDIPHTSKEIGVNVHTATGVTGDLQAVNALIDADIAEDSTKWQDIASTDLSTYATGGCFTLTAPYTHLRAKVTAGTCGITISSNTHIKEV